VRLRTRSSLVLSAIPALVTALGCKRVEVAEASSPTETKAPVSVQNNSRAIHATGTIRAVRVYSIKVPRLDTQNSRITLVRVVPSGVQVKEGDLIAEFDSVKQVDDIREAKAKYEDLSHQVRQKQAQNNSDAQKRLADIQQAEADRDKAQIQLRKGPILSEIDRKKNGAIAEGAAARVESLKKSHELRSQAEAAALRILELQMERQKVAMERASNNLSKLIVKAPLAGMAALETIWKGGSMGHAQEGDQLWPGQPLLKIFDPSEMLVQTAINEPDHASLKPGARATVQLDAYPDAIF